MKRLFIVCLVALLVPAQVLAQCDIQAARRGDRMSGEDKKLHMAGSFVAGVMAKDLLHRRSDWAAFGLAMVPGLVKEALDASEPCNFASWRDIVADALGALLGVKFRGLIVTPKTISYEATW